MLRSAGSDVPWLGISSHDTIVPFIGSRTINLTYHGEGLAAGTYRAQLCLFADYSYGKPRTGQERESKGHFLGLKCRRTGQIFRLR